MGVETAKSSIAGIISAFILITFLLLSSFPSVGLDEWPAFLNNAENTGNTTSEGPLTDNILWSIPNLGGSGHNGWSSPVVVDGRVFHTQGPEGFLYCLNEINGTEIWNTSIGASQYTCSTPTVVDENVYVVGNKLYCFWVANGTEVWNKPLPGSIIGTSSLAVADGKVFINTGDICCYYASNGTLIWNRPGDGGGGESSPAYSDGRVYVNGQIGSDPNLICMYADNGTTIWNMTGDWSSTSPVVDDGKVFFNIGDGYSTVCLYASNGTEIWSKVDIGDDHASVAVANDRVVVNDNVQIYCYYISNGTQIWMATISSSGCSTPAISSDGMVYINGGGNTYCLDLETGAEIWSYPTGGAGWSSIGVANGRAFVNQGELYCFGPPLPTIDFIVIRDAPNGGGINLCDPANYPSYSVGYVTTFHAAAYNYSIGYMSDVQLNAIWNTTNTSLVSVTSPGNWTTVMCSSTDWGTATISVDDGNGHLNSTQVTISNPDVDFIQIRDAPGGAGINLCDAANYHSYPVGFSTIFYGAEYNETAQYLGDVPIISSWDSSDQSIVDVDSSGSSSAITCSNSNWGTATITLDDGSGHMNTTQVTVLDVTVDYIQIRDAPNGMGNNLGNPANYPSYPVGQAEVFYGAAYNSTSGYVTDLPMLWFSQDSSVVSVTSTGSSTNVVCSPTNSGTVTITADDGSGHTNTTQVTVLEPTVDYIHIRSLANGGGDNLCDPVNYRSYPLTGSDTFYGARYNSTAGYLDNTPATSTWTSSTSNTVSVSSPGMSATLTCNSNNYGTVTITLNDGLGHTNSTQVTVLEPTADYIQIRDSPDGSGDVITSVHIELDAEYERTYYCAAYNYSYGYMGEKPGQWDVTGGVGIVSIYISESTVFTAIDVGTGSLIVSLNSVSNSTEIIVVDITGFDVYPEIINIEALGADNILIEWELDLYIDQYQGFTIERSENSMGPWVTHATVTNDTFFYTDSGLEPDTTYYYRVYYFDAELNPLTYSSPASATTEAREDSSWVAVFILTVILIVVILLVLLILIMRQRKKHPPRAVIWTQRGTLPQVPFEEEVLFPDEEELPPPPEDGMPPPDDDWFPPPPPDY
jgi:outer membrane protein assembly factor BamB